MTTEPGQPVLYLGLLPELFPALEAAMSEVHARVYELTPAGRFPKQATSGLYTTFIHSLCCSEFCVFVYHVFWSKRNWPWMDFATRLHQIEPSAQVAEIGGFGRTGLLRREVRYPELVMRTRSLEALELLFAEGDMYFTLEDWILDRPDTQFPLEAFRSRGRQSRSDEAKVWKSMVQGHVAYIVLREFHGPVVATVRLAEEEVISAARQAATVLGGSLTVNL